ncbi:finTRIM family, member 14 [Silurus asotus]|uniref:FinTRIM family, member 14 n=1 Tax=Silurus asotus TaxID=30991 RepID=A0AAD5B7R0_SILAS|nr:finTRIM family, member 14 [Silurus asotus]
MAEASISVHQDQFSCPVCLDLLKDPVTTPCGHSFCKVCINDCWDQEDQKRVYSCPQCRHTFTPRPVLQRNNMLTEVVEKLKKTEVPTASAAHCYAGPGDVECDFCSGRKHKAIKSCLMCLASFCETHLKPHYEVAGLKKHTLIESCGNLQEKICSEHDKILEIYCRTDQSFICYLCMTDKHRSHDTVSVKAYRTEQQTELKEEQMKFQQRIQEKQKKVQELKQDVDIIKTELKEEQMKFQQRIQEKQKKVQELKQDVDIIKLSAQTAVDDSEKIFTEMISSMEKKHSEVTELIRDQEKAELSRVKRLLEQLEQEISDLQRRITELEQLSHTHDHIHFLQEIKVHYIHISRRNMKVTEFVIRFYIKLYNYCIPSLNFISNCCMQVVASRHQKPKTDRQNVPADVCEDSLSINVNISFDAVRKSLSDLKKRLEEFCQKELIKIHEHDFCDLTLDPNTVQFYLILSEKNKVVTRSNTMQPYSDHPERFDYYQVLSKESVCGRCYWEVEWSSDVNVFISVSYKDIKRKGRGYECVFGRNSQSWSLQCSCSSVYFWHNNIKTDLKVPSSSKIGVYVDYSAGTLSFYSVSDMMKLLHRLHTTFTQPLYAGFWLCKTGSTMRLCRPKE